ncbi:phosphorothioated DNA-binding restriction endonuclease [Serratia sp. D1N4]
MITSKTLQTAISNLTVWRKGDQRAPHKPLLLLYVLAQYQKGHERMFNYGEEIHQPLLELLHSFGPQRREHYPTMPFWRLRSDGFWELQNAEFCSPQKGNKEPPKREIIEHGVMGGFDEESYQLLRSKPALLNKLAQQILSEHFPDSLQELLANRLDLQLSDTRKVRDPAFRQTILRAYNYQCAVCGYNLRHDSTPVGLEAAHIKWKQYGGPCTVTNGLALCSLHHSAFDMGVIGLDDNMKLLVSEGVNGSQMVERLFWDFAGRAILLPKNAEHYPLEQFVEWHRGQVFKA